MLLTPARFAAAADKTMASVVSSKEWLVRRAPAREEEFVGDVRYKAGGNEFTSDWALFKHEPQQWNAKGRVVIKHAMASGDAFTARGEQAAFNQKSQRGSLDSSRRITCERRPGDGAAPDFGEAGRLEWEGRDNVSLTGEAHLWGPRLEGWADRADYDGAAQLVKLTGGRPVLSKLEGLGADWVGALKADVVLADRAARKISAEGAVHGWLEFRDLPEVRK